MYGVCQVDIICVWCIRVECVECEVGMVYMWYVVCGVGVCVLCVVCEGYVCEVVLIYVWCELGMVYV